MPGSVETDQKKRMTRRYTKANCRHDVRRLGAAGLYGSRWRRWVCPNVVHGANNVSKPSIQIREKVHGDRWVLMMEEWKCNEEERDGPRV